MRNLFVSYFRTGDQQRDNELSECLQRNVSNPLIDKVFMIIEGDVDGKPHSLNEKVKWLYVRVRPTYNVLFDLVRQNSDANDINIIANSDIYFDETLAAVDQIQPNDIFALCRWECATGQFLNRRDSQDVWIMRGHPRNVIADFTMGIPGCDNAIADRFAKVGYSVISPSKTIKTWHLHSSDQRTYSVNIRVPQPYKFMERYT